MQRKAARLAQLGLLEASSLIKINALHSSRPQPAQEKQPRHSADSRHPVTGQSLGATRLALNLNQSSGRATSAIHKIKADTTQSSLAEIKNFRKIAG
ncbi:hypothetical protein ACMGGR_03205 [Erwinia sp. BNK-24-b]|uniref:hypothetical protein n=1 Tax=unclassified Erwinia TaxID=2622719 RepID=UPI0039BEEB17